MGRFKLQGSGVRHSKRIVNQWGNVVATVDELANGKWILTDMTGHRMNCDDYMKPSDALKAFEKISAPTKEHRNA